MTWNLDSETVARLGRQQFFRNIDAAPEKKHVALGEDGRRPFCSAALEKSGKGACLTSVLCLYIIPPVIMTKWLVSLGLILTLGSSVLAGMPIHSGGSESGMLDCCKKALEQNDSPHVAAARLCCAMNCNDPASTSGNPGQSFSQTSLEPSPLVVVSLPPATNYRPLDVRDAQPRSSSPKPAYILNLALLI
jgi:hypothetical protein